MSRSESWQVRRVAASLGAEVLNADLSEISTDEADCIKELLSKHKSSFFRVSQSQWTSMLSWVATLV